MTIMTMVAELAKRRALESDKIKRLGGGVEILASLRGEHKRGILPSERKNMARTARKTANSKRTASQKKAKALVESRKDGFVEEENLYAKSHEESSSSSQASDMSKLQRAEAIAEERALSFYSPGKGWQVGVTHWVRYIRAQIIATPNSPHSKSQDVDMLQVVDIDNEVDGQPALLGKLKVPRIAMLRFYLTLLSEFFPDPDGENIIFRVTYKGLSEIRRGKNAGKDAHSYDVRVYAIGADGEWAELERVTREDGSQELEWSEI